MRGFARVLVCLVAAFGPAGARQDVAVCGTHRDRLQEALHLHRQALRLSGAPAFAIMAAPAPAPTVAYDAGDIAVLEDSGGVVGRLNPFDLAHRTVSFLPSATGASRYQFQTGDDTYDVASAAAGTLVANLGDDDARQFDLPFSFPFFGASYQKVFLNSDGDLTFTASDAASTDRSLGRMTSGPPRIAGLFRDLDPTKSAQGVRVFSDSSRFVVSWVAVPEYQDFGAGLPQTFQIRLYPDGRVQLAFSDVTTSDAIVGISPGALTGATSIVSFSDGSSDEYTATIAEPFSSTTAVDIVTTAQKFYQTHQDAYDYLVIFNNEGIGASAGAVAYEVTVRNNRSGYGDTQVDSGGQMASASRLQSVMNMGPLNQYPADPGARVPARFISGDTPLTVLGHEAGHLFLAFASVHDPNDPSAKPMLGRQLAHWSFLFNSEASLLEGNRIQDNGPNASPRFATIATAEGYAALDQYLMGFRTAAEVPPTFLVTNSPSITNGSRAPQVGVSFDGDRRDIHIEELIAVEGRRTPDSTVAQRRFRFGFILIVAQGTQPSADDIAKLEAFRSGFESFYARASSTRATADPTLRRSLKLSVFPAAGVLQGSSASARLTVAGPLVTPLTIALKTQNGVAQPPASVTIPAQSASVTFNLQGLQTGVEELSAEPADPAYETAFARLQVLAPADVQLSVLAGANQVATPGTPLATPILLRAADVNNLPYPGVRIQAAVTAGGVVDPPSALTDDNGQASFRWTPSSGALNELVASITSGPAVTVTALGQPMVPDGAVVNAASYQPGISPGSFATIFGANLAAGLPAQTRVLLGTRTVVPFYSSERQVNFLVPSDLSEGTVDVSVSTPMGFSTKVHVAVASVAPGIFFDSGSGYGAVLMVAGGKAIEIYGTGFGALQTDALGLLETKLAVDALVAGKLATVTFHGQAPGFPGLNQIDVLLPDNLPAGEQTLSLSVGGLLSNQVKFRK